jgi:hypothetical protein
VIPFLQFGLFAQNLLWFQVLRTASPAEETSRIISSSAAKLTRFPHNRNQTSAVILKTCGGNRAEGRNVFDSVVQTNPFHFRFLPALS